MRVPDYIREVVEQLAFLAREDKRVDKRSGVSPAAAHLGARERRVECRAPRAAEPRTTSPSRASLDIYSALPAITGKLELEYEGELKGGDTVARELIRTAVGKVYDQLFRRRQHLATSSSGSIWAAR